MNHLLQAIAALVLCANVAWVVAAEPDKGSPRTADIRACEGVTNENSKARELRRELGAYLGQTMPEDLERRVKKHIELVAKLKAECEQQQRETVALPK